VERHCCGRSSSARGEFVGGEVRTCRASHVGGLARAKSNLDSFTPMAVGLAEASATSNLRHVEPHSKVVAGLMHVLIAQQYCT